MNKQMADRAVEVLQNLYDRLWIQPVDTTLTTTEAEWILRTITYLRETNA